MTLPERIRKLGEWDRAVAIDEANTRKWALHPAQDIGALYIAGKEAAHSRDSFAYELLAEAAEVLDETRYWLRRMKDLAWDQPEYAPRFKASMNRHEQLLARITEAVERKERGE